MWYLPLLLDGVNSQTYIYTEDAGLYRSYTAFPFTSTAASGTVFMSLNTSIFNLPLVLNKWAHFAYTINSSGNFILYMNGVQVGNVTTNQVGSYTTTTGSVTGSVGTVTLTVASLSTFTNGMQIIGLPSGYGTVTISSPPSGSSIVCSYGGGSPTLINPGTAIANTIPGNTYTTSAFPNYIKYLVLGNQVYNARPATVQIQDVRIYKSVLTPAQIYGIYQSQGIPPRLTATSNIAQPALLWSFNGSNVDSVTGLSPSVASIGTQAYVSGLFGQGIFFNQTGGTIPTQFLSYTLPNGITANNCTVSMWVKPSFTIPSSFGNQISVCLGDSQSAVNYQFGMNSGASTTQPFIYVTVGGSTLLSGTAVSTGAWYHAVGVFSNVGQSGQNTLLTYYHNGKSVNSASLTRSATSFMNILKVGAQDSGTASAFVSVQDLRFYNTALSASQIQAIYQSGAIPPSLTLTKGPTYPLAQTSIVSSALGLYSTRALVSTYTGPVVQVRRNSDSTTYDFIADIYGNLSNVQNSTSMGGFLNTTTGNVSTWYDQSGAGKHFTQATAVSQPQLVLNSGQWVLWFNRDASPTFYASMTTASPITGVMTILYNYNMSTAFNDYTTLLGQNGLDNRGFRFTYLNVFGDATGGNRAGQDFLGTNGSYCYLNNSYGQMVDQTTGARIGNQGSSTASVWNQVIGTQGTQSFSSPYFNSINAPTSGLIARAAYGYLSEMMLFSAPINSADAQTLWARTPLTNPLPTKTTSG
jgi:hypothetical protein